MATNKQSAVFIVEYVTPIHAIIMTSYLSQQVVPETHDSFRCH